MGLLLLDLCKKRTALMAQRELDWKGCSLPSELALWKKRDSFDDTERACLEWMVTYQAS